MNKPKSINIFMIDDSEVDSFVIKSKLVDSDFINDITIFENSNQALDFILAPDNSNNLPDLLLLDIEMPGLDGFEFLDLLEESDKFEGDFPFKIFLLTNSKNLRDREKYKRANAVLNFVNKSVSKNQLETLIYDEFNV